MAAMLVAALYSLSIRYKVEASNKAVGIMMDGQSVSDLAAASGQDLMSLLADLKGNGLTGIALTEETVGEMIEEGQVTLSPKASYGATIHGNPGALARIAQGIARRGGMGSAPGEIRLGTIDYTGDVRALRSTSAGINPGDAADVRDAGLVLIARHSNVIGAGPAYIHDLLKESKALGATAYLASGEQVLGQRDSLEDTSSSLESIGMLYLTPEFAKIAGDARLTALIPHQTIRLHSMQQAEIDKATPASIIDRFRLAYRERNIRWLLVRPVTFGGPDPVLATKRFLESLKQGLVHEGGTVRTPHPFANPEIPKTLFVLIGLFAIPFLFFAARSVITGDKWKWPLLAASVVAGAASFSDSLRPLSALAIGIAGPVVAYGLWLQKSDKKSNFVLDLLLISGISLASGLAVAGLLNGLPYYIQVKQALGVKAILMLPIVLIGWMLLNKATSFKEISKTAIEWGAALIGLLIVGAMGFLIVRSGNDSPSAVSDSELKIRALLDQFLYTRPRTKDFLIGHPALVLGLLLFQRAKAMPSLMSWAVIALAIGAIGQSDIVDTMCHVHTPLDIGIARVVIGLVLGGIIGFLLWLPVRVWINRHEGK